MLYFVLDCKCEIAHDIQDLEVASHIFIIQCKEKLTHNIVSDRATDVNVLAYWRMFILALLFVCYTATRMVQCSSTADS